MLEEVDAVLRDVVPVLQALYEKQLRLAHRIKMTEQAKQDGQLNGSVDGQKNGISDDSLKDGKTDSLVGSAMDCGVGFLNVFILCVEKYLEQSVVSKGRTSEGLFGDDAIKALSKDVDRNDAIKTLSKDVDRNGSFDDAIDLTGEIQAEINRSKKTEEVIGLNDGRDHSNFDAVKPKKKKSKKNSYKKDVAKCASWSSSIPKDKVIPFNAGSLKNGSSDTVLSNGASYGTSLKDTSYGNLSNGTPSSSPLKGTSSGTPSKGNPVLAVCTATTRIRCKTHPKCSASSSQSHYNTNCNTRNAKWTTASPSTAIKASNLYPSERICACIKGKNKSFKTKKTATTAADKPSISATKEVSSNSKQSPPYSCSGPAPKYALRHLIETAGKNKKTSSNIITADIQKQDNKNQHDACQKVVNDIVRLVCAEDKNKFNDGCINRSSSSSATSDTELTNSGIPSTQSFTQRPLEPKKGFSASHSHWLESEQSQSQQSRGQSRGKPSKCSFWLHQQNRQNHAAYYLVPSWKQPKFCQYIH